MILKSYLFWIIFALSLSITIVESIFWLIGPQQCRGITICYEFSSIFQVFKYVGLVLPVSATTLLFTCVQILTKIRSTSWEIFTAVWIPLTIILAVTLGGSSNGWIPTGPSSQFILLALLLIYILISTFILLRARK